MVDFTSADSDLAQTFSTKKHLATTDLQALGEATNTVGDAVSYKPEVPDIKFDTSLPANVKQRREALIVRLFTGNQVLGG